MKMKTNFTTSKSQSHRPTSLTRTHDAGWILVFMPCVSASNIEFLTIYIYIYKYMFRIELLLHYSSHHCRHCCQSWSSKALLPSLQILDAKGNDVDLSIYKGKVLLIVNVASQCGLTNSNYKELSQLYEKYKDQGLL
ncbi:uncharacterized protein LOC114273834 isoform X2 [Camellia sinensis]|uniref:uncharacterized protein LOC114273834 isoform X2 n=1 Tax=Camellia sinensis TaxID=4442 RepID=UPI001036A2DC|nr:uncharacterized protein LOC114273834 isoform X2 [Camellia sinensis]